MNDTLMSFIGNATASVGGAASGRDPLQNAPAHMVEAAREFESVFLSQFLETMTKDLQGGALGGGDNPLTGLIKTEYASLISKSGGIGVGDSVLREMLKMQEIG